MGKRDYERLPIEQFGRQLITSGDLDPVYIALSKVDWSWERTARWLVAYWCWYHCGAACWLSEHDGQNFWREMMSAAHNTVASPTGGRWPRGHERRHARGRQAVDMVADLRFRYGDTPHDMVGQLEELARGGVNFSVISAAVRQHRNFGPWIAFKVGDMMERVLGSPVNFSEAAVFMFKDPMKAAEMLYRERFNVPVNATLKMDFIVHPIVEHLKHEFKHLTAPPLNDRGIDLQEVETVLCKWKSHMNGHYPLFNDIDEIQSGLAGWGLGAEEFNTALMEGTNLEFKGDET